MEQCRCREEAAAAKNSFFDEEVYRFLRNWVENHTAETILQFDQSLETYLSGDALRDFFLNSAHPVQELLTNTLIAEHLGRPSDDVSFDEISGDPLLSLTEQRIYNLARRLDSERMHIPFRSIHPNKQTNTGDIADIITYPADSEIRYNSGNHFSSRPANNNVFRENSQRCLAKTNGQLQVVFKRGYLEERLQDIKQQMLTMNEAGETQVQFFVICSRHSVQEGHFGVSLVIMNPANPHFPERVIVCDTLLKELPNHPRWWNHFVSAYANVFGDAVKEIIEDLSHPLQKVNIKGDDPYRHDWDCPYYTASMADALADLITDHANLAHFGTVQDIYDAMKDFMPDYYGPGREIKDRQNIRHINRLKRWESGRTLIYDLLDKIHSELFYAL